MEDENDVDGINGVESLVDETFSYSSELKLLSQGAEARLYRCVFLGKPAVMKERFTKHYRHPELDRRLTKERIRNESRAIVKCKQMGIDVPTIYFLNTQTNAIIFEYIDGVTAKEFIEQKRDVLDAEKFEETVKLLGREIGKVVSRIHSVGFSHGDLTTSNVMLRDGDPNRVCFIDFGLSANRSSAEDFGVDLYVLERAIRTTHVDSDYLMDEILDGYSSIGWKGVKEALKKLAEVRMRGRKREMIG
ncbi:Non-specific serine/threonine protein kinase [Aphelenchoides besseyi]|nr:Non-specific serine/threonine protein kinase [Aphelenchoides besseyi]KAI6231902.1 Non-specific serine/threonine protein kinase [Aphelenchoides besseyi]